VLTVTAVIPTFNSARTLPRAIDSVLAQTVPVHVIVVDDGSTDDSTKVLERYGSRIEVVRQKNAGAGAARSAGTRAARTDLVAYLDADDAWHPDKTEKQLTDFNDPEVGLSGAACQWIDPNGEILRVSKSSVSGRITRELFARNYINTSTAIVRLKHLDRLSTLFKPELFPVEDWELWIRLSTVSKFVVSPRVLVDYHVLPASGTRTRSVEDFMQLYARVFREFRNEPLLRDLVIAEDTRIRANLHFFAAYMYYEDGSYARFLKELFHSARLSPLHHPWANTLPMLVMPPAIREKARRFIGRLRYRPNVAASSASVSRGARV
jgi:glycosyltransferase involved in cell wall biosynthesis